MDYERTSHVSERLPTGKEFQMNEEIYNSFSFSYYSDVRLLQKPRAKGNHCLSGF